MRIVAGEFGGRRLRAPRGTDTRPTADRVRESMFAVIGPVEGAEVLDLFAGSGALALEALSRGAARATLVDRSATALAAARANVAALGLEERTRLIRADWQHALRLLTRERDRASGAQACPPGVGLCLLDPPYTLLPRIAGRLGAALAPLLAPGAMVVIEHDAGIACSLEGLAVATAERRAYGDTAVTVLRGEGC